MMSTRFSVVIILSVVAWVRVTQGTTSECFVNNVDTFMDELQDCSPYDIFDSVSINCMLLCISTQSLFHQGHSITNATLSAFCPSQCAIAVNIFFEIACNLSYSEIGK